MNQAVRLAGFAVLAVAAVVAWVVLAPKLATDVPTLPSATQYETLIADALSAHELNNASAAGAPQQQVVNGWTARDLLTIIAKENVDILRAQGAVVDVTGTLRTTPFDERVPALLLIGVLAVCWAGVSTPRSVSSMVSVPPAPAVPSATPLATA